MLTKQNLEQMLNLLEITTLEKIDSKCRQDAYTYGQQPMLKYSPEALVEYASAIYQYILPHFDTVGLTEDEYIAKWVAPHTKCMKLIAAKDYMVTLIDIIDNPKPAPTGYNLEKDIYAEISAYIDNHRNGSEWYFFEGINDFLTNSHSPLRWDTITDKRIIDLIAEVDAIREACNKELEAFAVEYIDTYKNEKVYFPIEKGEEKVYNDKNFKKVRYKSDTSKIAYGTELKYYRKLVQEKLAYYKLKPRTVSILKASKDQLSPADWQEISQALENKVITENTRKIITATLKAFRTAAKAKKTKTVTKPVDPEIAVDANEVFISNFIQKLSVAYAMPVTKKPTEPTKPTEPNKPIRPTKPIEPTAEEILDDLYSTIDVLNLAHKQDTSIDTIEAQQKATEKWYSDFNNIVQPLVACLEISMNNLSPETVLSDEVLSHGAIKGMLLFAKNLRLKVLYKLNTNILDYAELSKELRHNMQVQTDYYTSTEPLPEVEPLSKVQLIDNVNKGTAAILPSIFDLTQPIQEVLDSIKANVVTTGTVEVLSEKDAKNIVSMLMPITDYTIKEMASMLTGQPSIPYLADGTFVIHVTETGKYLKVVPAIRDDKYTEYQFRSYNWLTLNAHIHSLQQMLAKTPEYLKWQTEPDPILELEQGYNPLPKDYSYKLLPKDVELRKTAIKEAEELYEFLLDMVDYAFDSDDETVSEAIRTITTTHYYKDFIRISGHRLSSWVYDPEGYRLISNPPVDANGYAIDYEPNHINGIRSDNRPCNLKIELKQTNLDLRSTSRPVTYNGQPYLTLKKYCDAYGLSYDYLNTYLASLLPGETKEHNNGSIKRAYSLGADGWTYIATDVVVKVTQITFNGKEYATPKDFADDLGFDYEKIRQGLYRAKKKNKTEYKCKEKNKTYTFYLDTNGNVTKIL